MEQISLIMEIPMWVSIVMGSQMGQVCTNGATGTLIVDLLKMV